MVKPIRRYALMLVISMLSLAIFACAMPGSGAASETEETVAAVATEAAEEAAPEEPAAPAEEEPAAPVTAGSLDELDSYRVVSRMSTQAPDGSWVPSYDMEIAVVNNPPPHAEHIIMRGEGDVVMMEMITIGDMSWMNAGGMWVAMPADDTGAPTAGTSAGFEMPEDISANMVLVGTEVVNGITCDHYTFDVVISSEAIAEMTGGMAASDMPAFDSHVVGETWIAAQAGLPPIAIRSDMTQTIQMSEGVETLVRTEVELSDINQPITIEPPTTP
jgi:hypothetical protein